MNYRERDRKPFIPISGKQTYIENLTASRVADMPLSKVVDPCYAGISGVYVTFLHGQRGSIRGLFMEEDGTRKAYVDDLRVAKSMQRRGIGSQLMKAFIIESKSRGATELWSEAVSNMSLGMRVKLLGEASLNFYDSENPNWGILPMTYQQALLTNDRVDELDKDDEDRKHEESHIGVFVDLETIDTTEWSPSISEQILHFTDIE